MIGTKHKSKREMCIVFNVKVRIKCKSRANITSMKGRKEGRMERGTEGEKEQDRERQREREREGERERGPGTGRGRERERERD